MPCTTVALREHIKRSYLQANMWMTATVATRPILDNIEMYGWTRSETGELSATLLPTGMLTRPANLLDPCTCKKCAFDNKCICRVNRISCCRFCRCDKEICKNVY